MGPILRTADQGADTAVWLASAPEGVETAGGFWLDRRRRWEHKLPWTRLPEPEFLDAGGQLWSWCARLTGWDGLARPA
jgi:dehydrogenase/reductase SDR family protein 12